MKRVNLLFTLIFIVLLFFSCGGRKQTGNSLIENKQQPDSICFNYENITGIGYEKEMTRRDPSDVIKVNGKYYVWYTKVPHTEEGKETPLCNSGYYGTIWYATSNDGYSWIEKGQALAPGEKDSFDSHAVFTPNILFYKGKYYLYYTGVKPTPGDTKMVFENNSETDITGIGLAISDSPDGPFSRIGNQPILTISEDTNAFDSYRIDDAALNIRDDKIWLYYKGRSLKYGKKGPRHTQMGIAFADKPEGPYKKYGNPVLDRSHEVIIWNTCGGVAALGSLNSSLNFASDGINFSIVKEGLPKYMPAAPGLYRPSISSDKDENKVSWGICMGNKDRDVFLLRYSQKLFY